MMELSDDIDAYVDNLRSDDCTRSNDPTDDIADDFEQVISLIYI
jgi:hypothetical protein